MIYVLVVSVKSLGVKIADPVRAYARNAHIINTAAWQISYNHKRSKFRERETREVPGMSESEDYDEFEARTESSRCFKRLKRDQECEKTASQWRYEIKKLACIFCWLFSLGRIKICHSVPLKRGGYVHHIFPFP